MTFSYVRRKDQPEVYLMAGYCDFTGQFDEAIYEQAAGTLPENAILEVSPSPSDTLNEQVALLNTDDRAAITASFLSIRYLLSKTPADTDAARILIEALSDTPYSDLKQAVLATLT